jgi:hypothetical protein
MNILAEIRRKLIGGESPSELIKEGYAKSSVYYVWRRIKNEKSGINEIPPDDELTELRRKREIVKLQTEIQQLEADKEKLPERIAKIETDLQELRKNLFEIWAMKAVKATREDLSCPRHGRTMGIVFKCKVCSYEKGLGWGHS